MALKDGTRLRAWTDKKPAPKCSSHALKTAPQRSPSGRLRNSKTPWHWKTEVAPSKQAPMPNVAFWTDKKPAPKCSSHALKVFHNKVLAGGCETANMALKDRTRLRATAPQQTPSGRLRNSTTPWPWRTERACGQRPPVPNVAFWTNKKPAPKCSSHALKTAPQRSPSGRLRNSKTPWPWRTERPPNQSQEQVPWRPERPFWNPTRNPLLSCYRARILSYPAILLEI